MNEQVTTEVWWRELLSGGCPSCRERFRKSSMNRYSKSLGTGMRGCPRVRYLRTFESTRGVCNDS